MRNIVAIVLTIAFLIGQGSTFPQEEKRLTIKDYLERALPPQEGRKVVYNEQAKLLTITDTKSNHRIIKQLIEQFEVGPRQVMIEARFVEVDITDLSEFGIEWFAQVPGGGTGTKAFSDWSVNPEFDGQLSGTGIQWDDSTTTTFPKVGFYGADIWISKTTQSLKNIQARLKALEQEGKANLLSAPKVTTVSGQMANMQVVRIQPYVSDFTLENIGTAEFPRWNYKLTVSEKSIGITLEVTPYVGEGSNNITLDIHPEVSLLKDQVPISNVSSGGITALGEDIILISSELGWPVVDTRTTQTSIAIGSGETLVLGGMIKDEETVTKRKVPILGNIPLLGKAFQYEYKNIRKKNLLIFITASIITAEGEVIK
ncbi:MAG: hypothetical protein ABH847_00630 [Candidatus Omnitrophota bacterium]